MEDQDHSVNSGTKHSSGERIESPRPALVHGPLPWRYIGDDCLLDGDDQQLACSGDHEGCAPDEPDLAFICQAVNAHDALVAACKEATHFMYPEDERQALAIVACNEAIKLATQKSAPTTWAAVSVRQHERQRT